MRPRRSILLALVVLLSVALAPLAGLPAWTSDDLGSRGWVWPVDRVRITRPFIAPPHPYAPGHRGIDLEASGVVRAPADGTVAFAGEVAGRPIVTVDHGDGLVTTFEPVSSDLAPGTRIARGQPVGAPAPGGHTAASEVHFGVRLDGEYINPLRLLGGVPRAVLLPCC